MQIYICHGAGILIQVIDFSIQLIFKLTQCKNANLANIVY